MLKISKKAFFMVLVFVGLHTTQNAVVLTDATSIQVDRDLVVENLQRKLEGIKKNLDDVNLEREEVKKVLSPARFYRNAKVALALLCLTYAGYLALKNYSNGLSMNVFESIHDSLNTPFFEFASSFLKDSESYYLETLPYELSNVYGY